MNQPRPQSRRNNRNIHHVNLRHPRARSLWDETRKPNAPKMAYLRAVLYEIQPIRFSEIQKNARLLRTFALVKTLPIVRTLVFVTLPSLTRIFIKFVKGRTWKEWGYAIAFICYWYILAYLHELLHAGPMILISTILVLIFTVGLGDNEHQEGYVSAYSVFNKGFRNILGSLDAENLLRDYTVGGGTAVAVAAANNHNDDMNDEVNHNRPRQWRDRQNNNEDVNQALGEQEEQGVPGEAQNDYENNNDNNVRTKARKSGKKARRKRNIGQKREQQREMELQREAAAALGFGRNDQDDGVAMNRLIEQEANAAANAYNNLD